MTTEDQRTEPPGTGPAEDTRPRGDTPRPAVGTGGSGRAGARLSPARAETPRRPGLGARLMRRLRAAARWGQPGTPVWPTPSRPALDTAAEAIADVEAMAAVVAADANASGATAATRARRLPFPWNAFLAVLTGVETLAFLMFVLIEPTPRWVLLVAAAVAVAGVDGTLRATYRVPFEATPSGARPSDAGADTTPYLFLPALYAFAAPILIEHNASGYAALGWALVAGAGFAAIAVAEVMSVRTGASGYAYARLVASAAAYFAAFALLATPYLLHLGLPASMAAAWLVCAMLGIELLREGEIDPLETVIFAAAAALIVAQTRWLLFFLPVEGYLAGFALLLVFFLTVGVLHAHVTRQLNAWVAGEYATIAALGLALVVAARMYGIA